MTEFRIEALTSAHSRGGFSCGTAVLDRYLTDFASQDVKRRISNCFVALDTTDAVAGFYTLAAMSVLLADIPPDDAKKLSRYPLLSAALVGRLAIDERFQGRRLGGALIMDAVLRSTQSDPAVFALIVDAKDDRAVAFYQHLGFRRCASRPMSLHLPIATALKAFAARKT